MLPNSLATGEKVEIDPRPKWVTKKGSRSSTNGVVGPNDIDDSLRCEISGICEGVAVCKPGEEACHVFNPPTKSRAIRSTG